MNVVEIKDLTKRFNVEALSGLSLSIAQGEIYGIIGPSGAGKSTLIHCLVGLESPTKGQILIAGEEISLLKGAALVSARKNIGMVFQHFSLFSSRTALDNVLYPLEIDGRSDKERGMELLKLVGLAASAHFYPSQLSGGQKQRVAIARALAADPKVLICDEPTSALDPETTASLLELLGKLNRDLGLTIILITHEMEVIKKICKRVAVLDEGRIVEEGSVLTLFATPKHPTTKRFLQSVTGKVPSALIPKENDRELLRLCFLEGRAKKPFVSHLVKNYPIEINILLGSIDALQEGTIGSLIVEFKGDDNSRQQARTYLEDEGVIVEVIT